MECNKCKEEDGTFKVVIADKTYYLCEFCICSIQSFFEPAMER